jgi:polynucleotide 5'-hydroxyl-kinase GRC3/NOL9
MRYVNFNKVPFSQAMIALNGTIVGLAIDHTKYYHNKSKEKSFGFIPTHTPSNHNCVGLGLVRAIDLELQCFYILSPVPSSTLEKVNLILRGSLECPVGLLIQGFDRSQVPYTSFMNAEGVGSVTLKNRHLGRKGRIN